MPHSIEVALFSGNDAYFYPKELEEKAKTTSELNMRIEVLPKFINDQEHTFGAYEEIQKKLKNLEAGERIKLEDEYHYSEMVAVRRFQEDTPPSIYLPRGIFKINIFKGMMPGEVIEEKNRKFRKDKDDGLIYVYEPLKVKVELAEVDTRRPWTIECYNGSEYIKYLTHVVVDENYNYYKV